jgi:phage tail sheath gpL-like
MPVQFDNIPGNVRVPFVYFEFRPGGTPYTANARLLLIGQKLAAGSAAAGQPIMVREDQASALAGKGSMLAQMDAIVRKNAPLAEVWWLPLDDLSGGVLATGKISVGVPALTQPQILTAYIAGRRIRTTVLTAHTRANIATNLAAEINATPGLPVTAAVNGTNNYEVDLTARHKGTLGNAIEIEKGIMEEDGLLGHTGSACVLTITAMASGAGDPDITAVLPNLGEDEFDWIVLPYPDSTNLGAMADWFSDVAGNWSWYKQIYGHAVVPLTTDVSTMVTFGQAQNRQHLSYFPARKFRSPPWEVAAAVGARLVKHLSSAPELSRPLQSLSLEGILGPRLKGDRLNKTDKQTLYYSGVSGYYVDRAGVVRIERVVTGYRLNPWGDADATYLDVETMAQSMYGVRYLRQKITNAHPRQALADANPGRLPQIVTVQDLKNTLTHGYEDLVALGVFENAELFARDVVVERDPVDANRVNASLPLDHVNQLRIFAASAVNYMQRREPRDALAVA